MNMNNTTNSIRSDRSTQKYQMRSVAPARKYCSAVCPILIVICKYYVHLNIPRARTTYSDIHIYVLIHWYQNATLLIVNLKHNNGKCTHAVTHAVSFSQRILYYLAFEYREAYSVHKSSLHNNGVLTYNLSYFTKRLGLDQETSLSLPCFNAVPVSR
jgi:hypothetical protein